MIASEQLEPVLMRCLEWAFSDFIQSPMGPDDRAQLLAAVKTLDRLCIVNRPSHDDPTGVHASMVMTKHRGMVEELLSLLEGT